MRKKDEDLRERLLMLAHEVVEARGVEALTIRRLAGEAGVAIGTVYNYFASKEDILLALTEAYWRQTLAELSCAVDAEGFIAQLRQAYAFLRARVLDGGSVLMMGLRGADDAGRERMQAMLCALGDALASRLAQDARVPPGVWTPAFTPEGCVAFVLQSVLASLRAGAPDVEFLLQLLSRALYPDGPG